MVPEKDLSRSDLFTKIKASLKVFNDTFGRQIETLDGLILTVVLFQT